MEDNLWFVHDLYIIAVYNAYVCSVGVVEYNTFSLSRSTTCASSAVLRAPSACENVNS